MTTDLAAWLGAQFDHDEQVAQAATPGPWTVEGNGSIVGPTGRLPKLAGDVVCSVGAYNVGRPTMADAAHIALHDPATVLLQVAAHRRIVARHESLHRCEGGDFDGGPYGPCEPLRDLASIYADRGGYDSAWAAA